MPQTALIAGVGPGLGESLARKFAAEGCQVGLLARTESYVAELAADLPTAAVGVDCDLTDPDDVVTAVETVRDELGPIEILVNHASGGAWKGIDDLTVDELDQAHAVGVRGGFCATRAVVDDMREAGGGTVIFTGATSALRGRDGALAFSAAKFGVRGMAESLARELGPEGIHVAHVVIDGQILPPELREEGAEGGAPETEEYLDPDAIAESYWHLVEQDRSAWTLELDLRPHVEEF
ncbi:SDR family NAD(P)-dependent oxidoreductase [Haloparvum sp. AD34]